MLGCDCKVTWLQQNCKRERGTKGSKIFQSIPRFLSKIVVFPPMSQAINVTCSTPPPLLIPHILRSNNKGYLELQLTHKPLANDPVNPVGQENCMSVNRPSWAKRSIPLSVQAKIINNLILSMWCQIFNTLALFLLFKLFKNFLLYLNIPSSPVAKNDSQIDTKQVKPRTIRTFRPYKACLLDS